MTILIFVVLVVLILGVFPRSGAYNAGWGYGPSGIVGVLLVVLVVYLLLGHRL